MWLERVEGIISIALLSMEKEYSGQF